MKLQPNIKLLLVSRGLKAIDVAAELGVTAKAFSNWSTGRSHPPAETLFKLAELLQCKVDDLYTIVDEKEL